MTGQAQDSANPPAQLVKTDSKTKKLAQDDAKFEENRYTSTGSTESEKRQAAKASTIQLRSSSTATQESSEPHSKQGSAK